MQTIKFEPRSSVNEVEQTIIRNLESGDENDSLLLDLSDLTFIQIETLIYLVSFIAKRQSQKKQTQIKYFLNKTIRDFFYTARFFPTIERVTGLTVQDITYDELPSWFNTSKYSKDIFEQDKISFSEEAERFAPLTDSERLDHLQKTGWYPLTSLPFKDEAEKSCTLKNEPKKWTESQSIISVIQSNIPDKKIVIGDKISKHIIYESITNSVRHPQSQNLVITSMKQDNYYTLVIWDDGNSIVDTLMNELKKENSIKTENSIEDIHSCYCIRKSENKLGRRPNAQDFNYFFSNDVPDLKGDSYKKEEWFVLLSSLFPGITRDPQGADYNNPVLQDEKPILTGRGLTYLINTAVRIIGGEVRIRTGRYFLNIQPANKDYTTLPDIFFKRYKNDYYVMDYQEKYETEKLSSNNKKIIDSVFRAKYNTFSEEGFFRGNMITIHISQK